MKKKKKCLLFSAAGLIATLMFSAVIVSADVEGGDTIPEGTAVVEASGTENAADGTVVTVPAAPAAEPVSTVGLTPAEEPGQTGVPAPAAEPAMAAEPGQTGVPAPAAEPAVAADPEQTGVPAPAEEPAPAAEPEQTGDPTPAAEPEQTGDPTPAADPAPAADPEQTGDPAPAEEPAPAADPVQTEEPAPAEEPVPAEEAVQTEEPAPAVDPVPTGENPEAADGAETTIPAEGSEGQADPAAANADPAADPLVAVPVEQPADEPEQQASYPAQTLQAEAPDGAVIVITAPKGALPEGAYVKVTLLSESQAASTVGVLLNEDRQIADLAAYDITIYGPDGNVIQPDSTVKVSIQGKELLNGEDLSVYHIGKDGAAEKVAESMDFDAESFSPYVAASSTLANGIYVIKLAKNQNMVMDVYDGNKSNSANIQLFTRNNTNAQKFWLQYNASGGYYTILNMNSARSLDVTGASTANGANVQQFYANGTSAQQWVLKKQSDGSYVIANKASGKVIDVYAGIIANGSNIQMYSANGTAAQKFIFELVKAESKGAVKPVIKQLVANGVYTIVSGVNGGKVLDVYGGSKKSGANVQLYDNNGSAAQKFQITYDPADDSYRIINVGSGLALDVYGGKNANGTNVQQYAWNGSPAQRWEIVDAGGGYVTFVSKTGKRDLDVYAGKSANGTNVQIYDGNGSRAQKWMLKAAGSSGGGSTPAPVKPSGVTGQLIFDGIYYISSAVNTDMVLDIAGGETRNGANVWLYTQNFSNAQRFKVTYDNSTKTYSIISELSGRAVSLENGSNASGANVDVESWNNSAKERWILKDAGNGFYSIISQQSGRAIDVAAGKAVDRQNVQAYEYNGTNAQRWQFLFTGSNVNLASGVYEIATAGDKTELVSVSGSSIGEGANVQLQKDANANNERFIISPNGDGSYRINNYNSGKLMAATSNGANGANVVQQASTDSASQRWIIRDAGGGQVYIANAKSSRFLASTGNKTNAGTNIQISNTNGLNQQKFVVSKQSVTPVVSNGVYEVSKASDGSEAISIMGGSRKVYGHVESRNYTGDGSQKFQISSAGDGYYTITNVNSGHRLAVTGGSVLNGMSLHQEKADGSLNQKWLIRKNENGTLSFINAWTNKSMSMYGKGRAMDQADFNKSATEQMTLKKVSGTVTSSVDSGLDPTYGIADQMLKKANEISSPTGYLIVVNRDAFRTRVYQGQKGSWREIRNYICSVGSAEHKTTPGLQYLEKKASYFDSGYMRLFYASKLSTGRVIHSVAYYSQGGHTPESPGPIYDGTLGKAVSSGCVRLAIENARWIYNNVPIKTNVYVY